LNARVVDLGAKIEAAKGDPKLVASLEAEAETERARAKQAMTKVLLAMVPGIQAQFGNIEGDIRRDEASLLNIDSSLHS